MRQKSFFINAWRNDDSSSNVQPTWFDEAVESGMIQLTGGGAYAVRSLEGWLRAELGDWILEDPRGVFMVVPDPAFRNQYEVV